MSLRLPIISLFLRIIRIAVGRWWVATKFSVSVCFPVLQ